MRNLQAWVHRSSLKRIYRLTAYLCAHSHNLKQFYYSICAFWACGTVYTLYLLCSHKPLLWSPGEHQQCLPQLQGHRDLKLWLSCWHWCVQHASCLLSLVEKGSDDSFLTWSFLFSNPSHPEWKNCLQASGVAEISPLATSGLVEGGRVSGGK